MGMGMTMHLLEDGYPVTGFDVTPMALKALLAMGGNASTPRGCVIDARFVICMVANSAQTEDVFFEEKTGAVYALAENTIGTRSLFHLAVIASLHKEFHGPGQ
jgi:3-hydroxyisobutyrate dehydrogenase